MTGSLTDFIYSWARRHSAVVAAASLALLLGGCRADEPMPDEPPFIPEGKKTAIFSLSIPTLSPTSRGDAANGEHEGESYESYINVTGQDYRFLFFDKDGYYLETLEVESLTMTSSNAIDLVTTYRVEGVISEELANTKDVKVLALANWGDYSFPATVGQTTIDNVCASQAGVYDYNLQSGAQGVFPSAVNLIPMFGVSNPQSFVFDPVTHKAQMEPISLLRAYAKIEVAAKFAGYSDLTKCSLKSVTLSRHNTTGCKAPSDIKSASDYVPSTTPGGWSSRNGVHLPQDVTRSDIPIAFAARPNAKDTYVLYVPEYINLNPNGTPRDLRAEMELTFEVPNRFGELLTETDRLEFKYYSDLGGSVNEGDYFNLCRNVWYSYTVTKSDLPYLDVTVDVLPYESIELNPNYGLSYDPVTNYLQVTTKDYKYWVDNAGDKWTLRTTDTRKFTIAFHSDNWGNIAWGHPVDDWRKRATHWFDANGNSHSLSTAAIAGMIRMGDESGEFDYYWYDETLQQKWLVKNDNFSVYVYQFYPAPDAESVKKYNPYGTPQCWYDYRGVRHEVSESEESVQAVMEWREFLNEVGMIW